MAHHIVKRGLFEVSSTDPCTCECIPNGIEMSDNYMLRFKVTSYEVPGEDGPNTFELSDDYTIIP